MWGAVCCDPDQQQQYFVALQGINTGKTPSNAERPEAVEVRAAVVRELGGIWRRATPANGAARRCIVWRQLCGAASMLCNTAGVNARWLQRRGLWGRLCLLLRTPLLGGATSVL